jgi:glycolate oxidase FAD binding subunit
VRLDDLAAVLASAGQRLALDPPEPAGTIGGLIATNLTGALRYRYGAPRDLLIGITVVRADGTIAHSGGKVVKNVAGYDLGKLFAGSYGTLGLITEATFRLHPLPETSTWISVEYRDPASAAAAVHAIADSPLTPAAIQLDWPRISAPLTVGTLLEGDPGSVAERAARLADILTRQKAGQPSAHTKRADGRPGHLPLPAHDDSDDRALADGGVAGGAFRVLRPPAGGRESEATLLRVAFWPGQLDRVLGALHEAAELGRIDPHVSGSAAAGVLEVGIVTGAADAVALFVTGLRARLDGLSDGLPPSRSSAVVLCAPSAVREVVDLWGPVPSLGLMRSVKDQFDPEHRMAPGRFAGGI